MVFVSTLIDATGIPFPGRLLLVAAGAIASHGRRNVVVIIALGALAAMITDHVWYVAGRRGSPLVLGFYRRLAGTSGETAAAAYPPEACARGSEVGGGTLGRRPARQSTMAWQRTS